MSRFDGPGVYFLWLDQRLIYVGQSKSVRRRIKQHRSAGMAFDSISVHFCRPARLLEIEGECLRRCPGRLNTVVPAKRVLSRGARMVRKLRGCASRRVFAQQLGTTDRTLARWESGERPSQAWRLALELEMNIPYSSWYEHRTGIDREAWV